MLLSKLGRCFVVQWERKNTDTYCPSVAKKESYERMPLLRNAVNYKKHCWICEDM